MNIGAFQKVFHWLSNLYCWGWYWRRFVILFRLMPMPQFSIQLGTGPRHCSWCIPRRTRVCLQDRGQRCGGQYSAPCQIDRSGKMSKKGGQACCEVLGCGNRWLAAISECQSVRYSDLCLGNGCRWTQVVRGSTEVHPAWWIKREVGVLLILLHVLLCNLKNKSAIMDSC